MYYTLLLKFKSAPQACKRAFGQSMQDIIHKKSSIGMPQGPGEFNFPHFPRSRENVKLCSMQVLHSPGFPEVRQGLPPRARR
jgi:hypothetical protein